MMRNMTTMVKDSQHALQMERYISLILPAKRRAIKLLFPLTSKIIRKSLEVPQCIFTIIVSKKGTNLESSMGSSSFRNCVSFLLIR